ncbi:uncharacterized protein LOC126823579 isoform X2 [Patella vulgata]|uniref:uncharacterized protein LOC126823579 isoform X2 n=1 Tax=Patella vulgata TaxID=6465 RepID=UPI0021807371|nr:uncharacterized protein LOC126823579 isoform X2 [Patella vulgata]
MYQQVKMRIKTDGKQFEMKEEEDTTSNKAEINDTGLEEVATEADSQMDFVQSNKKEEESRFEVKQHQIQDTKEADVDIPEESPAKPEGKRQEKIEEAALSERSEGQDEFGVRCPCGCNEDDGLMILCAACKFWQHGVCFQILDEDVAPAEHICDVCAQPGVTGKEPTDHSLVGMTPITVQATCLWRRALLASLELNRVLASHLARRLGVEATVAQGLINRLEKEGFVRNAGKGKRLGKLVEKSKIRNEGLLKYLSRKLNPSKIGRDMDTNDTQVTDSQRSQKQPVHNSRNTQQDVDSLVAQTESINISGKKNKSSERNKKTSTAQDFEICTSQDQDNFEPTHRRRRKSSIVTKAIMV